MLNGHMDLFFHITSHQASQQKHTSICCGRGAPLTFKLKIQKTITRELELLNPSAKLTIRHHWPERRLDQAINQCMNCPASRQCSAVKPCRGSSRILALAWLGPGAGQGLTNEQLRGASQQLVLEVGRCLGTVTVAAL